MIYVIQGQVGSNKFYEAPFGDFLMKKPFLDSFAAKKAFNVLPCFLLKLSSDTDVQLSIMNACTWGCYEARWITLNERREENTQLMNKPSKLSPQAFCLLFFLILLHKS